MNENFDQDLIADHSKEIISYLSAKTPEELDNIEIAAKALFARYSDSPEGFAAFYEVIHRRPCPEHAIKDWIEPLYEAKKENKGIVIEAFRGSTKTTTITITYTAFRIGKEPTKSNLLIQVGDDIASDNTAAVADIIANNPGWKMVYEEIVPDKDRGWGASGYEVKRSDINYDSWRAMNSHRKDPTLVGVGYRSQEIIGKHPDGILVIDDIHDENNTSSERELGNVMKILTGTIFPVITPETWTIFIGTPWRENDALNYVASTGEYVHIKTPIFKLDDGGKAELDGQKGYYTWEKRINGEEARRLRKLAGEREFSRMFMLAIKGIESRILKYSLYPNSEIRYNLPMVGGVDYASNRDVVKNVAGKGDYFAMAYLIKLPGGGAVVADGVLGHVTQGQGENYVVRAQDIFPNWLHSGVESVGKGDDFVQTILRNPGLRIIPVNPGRRSKNERIERELGPWLENGTIRISDGNSQFLTELRRELDAFPFQEHDDAIDAVYCAARTMPDVLVMPSMGEELPFAKNGHKKMENPFTAFGRNVNYGK